MKECNQCGKCCIKYSNGGLTTSASQIDYWENYRPEIYKYVKDGNIWMDPDTGKQIERCPWLRKAPQLSNYKNKYTCDIYFDRPDDCRFYPSSLDEMVADGCEMLEKKDLANPKQGQKALDIIMQDSRQEFEY
ncbi:MAG: YkgJ family cysteine cluster protein [Gammaproteobacteria bacterium]|nr:YkgJ family cysteine cluster protein [Gammaproteobacteria bacterium]